MGNDSLDMIDGMSRQVQKLMIAYRTGIMAPIQIPGAKKLSPLENEVMNLLEWQDGISIKEVVGILNVPNSTVTSAVNRLESKTLVRRISKVDDKRAFLLKLTQAGQDMVTFRQFKKNQFFKDLLDGLDTDEERLTFIHLLEKMTQSLSIVDDDQKRRGQMNALEKEYYDFGPWLIEIKDSGEIPQQYKMHRNLIENALYSFKVPIKKEWRHIHPGMLLYKTIVVIKASGLVLLNSVDGVIETTEIDAKEVRYIIDGTDLLDSHIIIGTDRKIYDIDYNSVSQEITNRVINTLRKNIFAGAEGVSMESVVALESVESPLYKELMNRGLSTEKVKVIAFQPFVKLERHNPSTTEVLLMSHNKYELQDVVILTNGKELIIVSRNQQIKKSKDTDYSFRHTFIKIEDISDFVVLEDAEMEHLKILLIYIGDAQIKLKISDDFDLQPLTHLLTLK